MSMISSSTGRAFGSVEVLFVKMLRASEVICTRATEVRPSHERGASYHVSSVGCHMTCGLPRRPERDRIANGRWTESGPFCLRPLAMSS